MTASDRLGTLKALTDEGVGLNTKYFLTITQNWGKVGYCSMDDAKSVLGLKSAAYTDSSFFAPSNHNHDSTYMKASAGTTTLDFGNTKSIGTLNGSNVNLVMPSSPFDSSGTYDSLTAGYAKNASETLATTMTSLNSSILSQQININNLLTYGTQGFIHRNWTVGSAFTPNTTETGTYIDDWGQSTSRVVAIQQLLFLNQTSSNGWLDLRVTTQAVGSSTPAITTFTLFLPAYGAAPFKQIMNLYAFTYEFRAFKNPNYATQSVKVAKSSVIFTTNQERVQYN